MKLLPLRHLLLAIFITLAISACAVEKLPVKEEAKVIAPVDDIKPEIKDTPEEVVKEPEVEKVEETPPTATPPPPEPKKAKIALLVPLSGQYSNIGNAMKNAAELALFDISSADLVLLPFDTAGTENGAKEAVTKAIDANVDIVLGPVFRHTTKAAASLAKERGVNVISFSNDKALLEDSVFLLSFDPAEQIERVVDYAHSRGINEFSALAPDNTYGITTIKELTESLKRKHLPFKKIEWYLTTDANLSKSIQRITRLPAGTTDSPEKSEGLLVPEGGRVLLSIVSRLYRKGVSSKRYRLLGSGEWDEQAITKEPKLAGGWFATSPPEQRNIFEKNFRNVFGYKPVRIASLAYDGIALAAFLVKEDNFSRKAILNKRGFVGVNGIFRFRENGVAERALAVIEITEESFRIIDHAPKSF